MDVGGATQWSMDQVVSQREILDSIGATLRARRRRCARPTAGAGRAVPVAGRHARSGSSPRRRRRSAAPATAPRSPRTGPGFSVSTASAVSISGSRSELGATDEEIADRIGETWRARTDRGAEERAGVADRGVLYQIESLRADPRREMHTRGG